jgi:hypothetical protein
MTEFANNGAYQVRFFHFTLSPRIKRSRSGADLINKSLECISPLAFSGIFPLDNVYRGVSIIAKNRLFDLRE